MYTYGYGSTADRISIRACEAVDTLARKCANNLRSSYVVDTRTRTATRTRS
jgi:hypothetical protein